MKLVVKKGYHPNNSVLAFDLEIARIHYDYHRRPGRPHVTIGSIVYPLKRGRCELVRDMPEDLAAELEKTREQIKKLRRQAQDIVEEAYRRGDPHVFKEPTDV